MPKAAKKPSGNYKNNFLRLLIIEVIELDISKPESIAQAVESLKKSGPLTPLLIMQDGQPRVPIQLPMKLFGLPLELTTLEPGTLLRLF